jgi:hypothetical protein
MSQATFTHSTTAFLLGRALSALGHLAAGIIIVCGGSVAVAFATLI